MDTNNITSFVLNKDILYYNTTSDATLYALHLDTKKQEELLQLPTDSKNRFIVDILQDELLRLDFYDEKELNSSLIKSYFVDLKEKKVKPYSLYTNDLHLPIDILSQTKDSYFVIYDYQAPEKYIDWANTYQSDIQETFYGLIKKKDYIMNAPKYTRIKEIR